MQHIAEHLYLLLLYWITPLIAEDVMVSCSPTDSHCLLPCSFSGEVLQVLWFRAKEMTRIPVQSFSKTQTFHQLFQYQGRAFLFLDEIEKGNASMLLKNPTSKDSGWYECNVVTSVKKSSTCFKLSVAAPVRAVTIDLTGQFLCCSSDRIYPKPVVTWDLSSPGTVRDNNTMYTPENGLFSVSSCLKVPHINPHQRYSCNISNGFNWRRATLTVLPPVVFSGAEVTLSCSGPTDLSLNGHLTWRFGRTIVHQYGAVSDEWREHVTTLSESTSLTLKNLNTHHQGVFICELSSDTETYISHTHLDVHVVSVPFAVMVIVVAVIITVLVVCCIYKKDQNQDSPTETPQPTPNDSVRSSLSDPNSRQIFLVKSFVFFLGVGSLLPWHIYITASLYFKNSISTALWLLSIIPMYLLSHMPRVLPLLLKLANFLPRFSLRTNVTFSLLLVPFLFLIIAVVTNVSMHDTNYFCLTMSIMWFSMFFSAILQRVGLLPLYCSAYIQGQSTAGVVAAVVVLVSVSFASDADFAAFIHFLIACLGSVITFCCYFSLSRLEAVQVYLKRSTNRVENQLLKPDNLQESNEQAGTNIYLVLKKMKFIAFCMISVHTVTLSVFPTITTDVASISTSKWKDYFVPVCCFVIFYIFNQIGAWVARSMRFFVYNTYFPALVTTLVLLRVLFIPIFMFCNVQSRAMLPVARFLEHDAVFAVIMMVFSLSNGWLWGLLEYYAMHKIKDVDPETLAVLKCILMGTGMLLGATLSFVFRSLI